MSTDIRVHTGFITNHKTKKLIRSCGKDGFFSLMALWCWVAVNRTNGDLTNMDSEDIEIAAGWDGEENKFIAECLRIGFIDQGDDCMCLHDWQKLQPWVVGAEARSNTARFSGLAKFNKALFCELKAKGVTCLTSEELSAIKMGNNIDGKLRNASEPLAKRTKKAQTQCETLANLCEAHAPTPTPTPVPVPIPSPAPVPSIKKKSHTKLSTQITKSFETIKELWIKAAQKWGFSEATGGKAAFNGYKAYIDNKGDIERATDALQAIVIKRPTDFYCNGGFFDLAWLFRKTNSKRQPCDNIQNIIDGKLFIDMSPESAKSVTTTQDLFAKMKAKGMFNEH